MTHFPFCFIFPGIPAKIFSRSNLAIASAPHIYSPPQELTASISSSSFLFFRLNNNFLCVQALNVKIRAVQIPFVIFAGCLSLSHAHNWLYFLTLLPFFTFHSLFFLPVEALSTLSFSFSTSSFFTYSLSAAVESKTYLRPDRQSFCVNLTCFMNRRPPSHLPVCVSSVSLARRCAPLTWSSWPACLMGGSRSRSRRSLFGLLFQMKSSRSRGADGCSQFNHLCPGCQWRTLRRKQISEQPLASFCRLMLLFRFHRKSNQAGIDFPL